MSKEKALENFIIDCPHCRAKVAALSKAETTQEKEDEGNGPEGVRILVGECPRCHELLVGRSEIILHIIENEDDEDDFDYKYDWSDIVRIYPKPPKTLLSRRIPRVVKTSLSEADKCIQVNANTAACVMLGRALEAMCIDALKDGTNAVKLKQIRLASAIHELGEKGIIDKRLIEWSDQLRAFRNIGAHAVDSFISREDAEDLQNFVYAILEHVYDLADRYNQFKARLAKRSPDKK